MNIRVTVIPMGDVEDALPALDALSRDIVFETTGPREPPIEGYSTKRQQYLGKAFLDDVRPLGYARAIALTDLDLYEPDLNFIFGLAETCGKVCVVSTAKLRHPNKKIFHERVRKEVVHELGHTLGLFHCKSSGCVMRFSNNLADVDSKGQWFCGRCARKWDDAILESRGVHTELEP